MEKINFTNIISNSLAFLNNNKLTFITGFGVFTFAFIYRLLMLKNFDFPPGTDCFVYLIQVKSLITEGKLHYDDISPVYHVMTPFFKVFESDFTAYKVFLSAMSAFTALGIFHLSKSLKKSNLPALSLALLITASPSLTFFLFQFPKNFFASIIFLFSISFFARKKVITSILLLAAASISHKMIAGTAVLFCICYAFFIILQKYRKYALFAIAGATIFATTVFSAGLLKIFDFSRFKGVFSIIPQLPHYSFYSFMTLQKMGALWIIEISALFIICIFFIYKIIKSVITKNYQDNISTSLAMISLFLLFPFLKFAPEGIAFRLFMQYFFITYIALIFSVNISIKKSRISAIVMVIVLIIGFNSYNSQKIDPPYNLYKQTALEAGKFRRTLSNFELFVAHKPLAEVMDYYTGEDTLPWDPEDYFNKDETFRLVCGITQYELLSLGDIDYRVFHRLPGNYFIITERDWEIFIEEVKKYGDEQLLKVVLSPENPYIQRPRFVKER